MGRVARTIYAIYNGDEFLYIGTAKECAEHFNKKVKTVWFWASPTRRKRIARKKHNSDKGIFAIRVEEEECEKN